MTILRDSFGRDVTYLRLSVTDRCDLRCTYCMAENMTFLPRKDLLSFEELDRLASAFISRGVRRIRITGGEPLVRRGLMDFIRQLSRHLKTGGLDEITLTTNATQLSRYADDLACAGVKRLNVSLDSRDSKLFTSLTRRAVLSQVLEGIEAAHGAGLKLKINTVALKGQNEAEIPDIMTWAHGKGMDMTLIEVMPMGHIEGERLDQYIPLTVVRENLERQFTFRETDYRTGGPSRYVRVKETGGLLGFITPLTQNFCAGCNRVRVTCTGQIYMCLGQSDRVDLRAAIRGGNPDKDLNAALDRAMLAKPERHYFDISKRGAAPAVPRHMSMTGG